MGKKREITAKDVALKKVLSKQGKVHFSLAQLHLSQYSKSSGPGDELASIALVYYESKDERKVLNAFQSAGIDLESVEAEPVDPASTLMFEQKLMYMQDDQHLIDEYTYEEGPPLSIE